MISSLAGFYEDKTIFITGATGMVGLAWTEKLLRVAKIRRAYALVRAAPGRGQARLEQCWRQHLPFSYEAMKSSGRIYALEGDVTAPHFNLSVAQREMLKREVSIVIHMAADISLVKKYSQLVPTNIQAVLALADFAESFDHLDRFVHVSTLFSQMHLPEAAEEIIPSSTTENELVALQLGKPLTFDQGGFAFDYAYTKNLAERIMQLRHPDLPLMIFRPSIIGPAIAEPAPMWTYLKSMPFIHYHVLAIQLSETDVCIHKANPRYLEGNNHFDEVPIDFVVNSLLAHTAAGTRGPVNAACGTLCPTTAAERLNYTKHLLPPQVFADISYAQMTPLARIFKLFGMPHPLGATEKTRELQKAMAVEDRNIIPIDLQNWDLADWNNRIALMLEEHYRQKSQSIKEVVKEPTARL